MGHDSNSTGHTPFPPRHGPPKDSPASASKQRGVSEERRVVTVMFADLVESTALAETLDPEDLRAILSRFYNLVAAEVRRFGGTVEKYLGDAALAIFGLPEVHEDDAERAVRAALAARDALAELNARLAAEGRSRLTMRIAVNTGEVVADPKGGELGEFRLAADAINVAARLQQQAKAGSILLAPRTERLVRGIAETSSLGPVTLRGKAQPIEAWEVIGLRPERTQRGIPGLQAPLIGRGEEMDLLLRLYDRVARERQTHLVTIVGAPGVGKSRLQQEFTSLLRALPEPPAIRKGRCLPYGDGLAFAPVAEIFKQDAQIMDGDPADAARVKFLDTVTRWLPDGSKRVAAALGFLVGLVFPDSPIAGLDPKSAREEAFASWRRYLRARSTAAALVLVFEDVHWADDGLLELVEYTASHLHDSPVLLLCLARPELLERRTPLGGLGRNTAMMHLEALSETESRALVAALLAVDDLPESVRLEIVSKAEGNPFFVEEIVHMLIDMGAIVQRDGRWRAAAAIGSLPLPETIQGVLAARLDRLPDEEKRLLQHASVIGRIFWAGTLMALGVGRTELPQLLERLEGRDLLRERPSSTLAGDREFIFKHALTREVAYASLPRAVRGPAHAKVAQWVEQTSGQRVNEVVDLLAYHWSSAGDAGKAVAYLIRAGDRARQLFANRRAADAYTQALALGAETRAATETAAVRRKRGEALQLLGQYDAAQGDFESALATAQARGDLATEARLRYEITRLYHRRHNRSIDDIIRGYEEARQLAVRAGDGQTEGLCLTEIATAHWDAGRLTEAGHIAHDALVTLQRVGDHGAIAGALNLLSMTRLMSFELDDGLQWAQSALDEARAVSDRSREATALSYIAVMHLWLGHLDTAVAYLDQSESLAQEIGDRRRLMWVHFLRSQVYLFIGRYDRAAALSEAARTIARELDYMSPSDAAMGAFAYLMAGDVTQAKERVHEAERGLTWSPQELPTVLTIKSFLLFHSGAVTDAVQALEEADSALRRYRRADNLLVAGAYIGYGWMLAGHPTRAAAAAHALMTAVGERGFQEGSGISHVVLAVSATRAGRLAEAEQHLRSAENTFQDISFEGTPMLPALVEVELAWYELRLRQGDPAAAEARFRQAEHLLDRIEGQLQSPELRRSFRTGMLARRVETARKLSQSRQRLS